MKNTFASQDNLCQDQVLAGMQAALLISIQLPLPSLHMSFHFDHSQDLLTFWEMSKSVSFNPGHARDWATTLRVLFTVFT